MKSGYRFMVPLMSLVMVGSTLAAGALYNAGHAKESAPKGSEKMGAEKASDEKIGRVVKTDAEWKKILPAQTYEITRQAGTEAPFTGKYWNNHQPGIYKCADCGLELFTSKTKFESGTGWPSFWAPIAKNHVTERVDNSLIEQRTEVLCARCGAHLGHVFNDGPPPTHLRYCMNSAALQFVKQK